MAVRRIHFRGHHVPQVHVKAHLAHWLHDGRFWAAVAIIVLSGVLIAAIVLSMRGPNAAPIGPIHPWPYPM